MEDGLQLDVRLNPKAGRTEAGKIEASGDGKCRLKISVTATPEGGKANAALIRFLAKSLRLPKSSITVSSGETNRNKKLLLAGNGDLLESLLKDWLAKQKLI